MTFAEEYCEKYLEKIFYFSLRKTGNEQDAADLAGEIGYEILSALHRGMTPRSFGAWVWQVAKNHYGRWAKKRYYSLDAAAVDIEPMVEFLEDKEELSVQDALMLTEDLALLRRELAFIRSDYRNILVAHYFEEKSVSMIAKEFSLPLGTVKTKLIESRKKLKEGMDMARTFGKRSYKPEQISFVNNGTSGRFGQPWTILNHALYKNIFLTLYDNAATAQELSLELGVALPYMEDELRYLCEQTFLKRTSSKSGDRYETTFPIVSAASQKKVHENNVAVQADITAVLEALIDTFVSACGRHGIVPYGRYISYEDAKWVLLIRAFDWFTWEHCDSDARIVLERTARPDGGFWDIVGRQYIELDQPKFIGQHGPGMGNKEYGDFSQYKYLYENIQAKTPQMLGHDNAHALWQIANGREELCDAGAVEELLRIGYARCEGERVVPNIVIFETRRADDYFATFDDEEQRSVRELADKARAMLGEITARNKQVVREDLPESYRNDEKMCAMACSDVNFERGYVLEQALCDGWLHYDENTSPVIGAYIYK